MTRHRFGTALLIGFSFYLYPVVTAVSVVAFAVLATAITLRAIRRTR